MVNQADQDQTEIQETKEPKDSQVPRVQLDLLEPLVIQVNKDPPDPLVPLVSRVPQGLVSQDRREV